MRHHVSRVAQVCYEESIIESGNIGKFFRFANSEFNARHNIGPLRKPDGLLTVDPTIKAELLSSYFNSVFTTDNGLCVIQPTIKTSERISDIAFTTQQVSRAISKLKINSAGGPDNVPPIFIKSCRLQLLTPLAFLYQLFFDSAYMPLVWLTAYISPIYKKGDSSEACNYRPISLTCTLCKIMEVTVKDHVMKYLLSKGLISRPNKQHAFIAKHSTVTNLLECTHDWAISLHSKTPVDVIYIDFSRAFNSVVHSKLLVKLETFGICGKSYCWYVPDLRSLLNRQ